MSGAKACTDCGRGCPAAWWMRCEDCAMERARVLMSGGSYVAPERRRGWARGSRVHVGGEVGRDGVVMRVKLGQYTVTFADGTRCHVGESMLSEPVLPRGNTEAEAP